MKVNDRLKKIIFKKLYNDLSHVEIIPYDGSIWFIDRDNKYWYLQLRNNGLLWWRWNFFEFFFRIFSLEHNEYEPIIADWVEDVLNHKVDTTDFLHFRYLDSVEEVLNNKVNTTNAWTRLPKGLVEEILNHKVDITPLHGAFTNEQVEYVLDYKVCITESEQEPRRQRVEQILNSK
jgi:hypothetical protein